MLGFVFFILAVVTATIATHRMRWAGVEPDVDAATPAPAETPARARVVAAAPVAGEAVFCGTAADAAAAKSPADTTPTTAAATSHPGLHFLSLSISISLPDIGFRYVGATRKT